MADALSTIRSRIKLKIGGRDNIDSLIDENINEAILQVIQEAKPQEMVEDDTFTTTSGQAEYSFSSISITNALAVLFVRDQTDDVPIYHASYEMWNRYRQDTSTANLGAPRMWTRYQNGIILFSRIPDSTSRTISWNYLKRPTRLSADADTFPLNDEWKRPVEELAAALTLRDLNSLEKSQAKLDQYYALLERRLTPQGEESASPEGSWIVPVSNLNLTS